MPTICTEALLRSTCVVAGWLGRLEVVCLVHCVATEVAQLKQGVCLISAKVLDPKASMHNLG